MFRNYGVDVLGVILNRVGPEEKDLLDSVGKAALEERGIRVLGIVPYRQMLETPTVREVMLATDGEMLNGEPEMENRVGGVILGVSSPESVLRDLAPHSIVVTCSDRSDLVLAALSFRLLGETEGARLAGLVLCGEAHPDEEVLRLIRRTQVPVLLAPRDACQTASIIRDLRGSIRPGDRGKIELVQDLVGRHIDVDAIFDAL
jgi:BioD-like phosphotransacetylase family protein